MRKDFFNSAAADVARPDKISGADINSICQEVSNSLFDLRGCLEVSPLFQSSPLLPPWVLGPCVSLPSLSQGLGVGRAGLDVQFSSHPFLEWNVGCP